MSKPALCGATMVLVLLAALGGCSDEGGGVPDAGSGDDAYPAVDLDTTQDAGPSVDADSGAAPDGAAPWLDGAAPKPDGPTPPKPDAALPKPDAVAPKPDAAAPKPDAAAPKPDAAPPKPSWLDDTSKPCPAAISQVGLFLTPTNRSVVDPRVHRFEPKYPLWTDGAGKGRWVFIPAGAKINNTNRAWTYPDKTALFKHFEYPGQPVETRVMVRQLGKFVFCIYRWNAAGTDAALLPGNSSVAVKITSKPALAYTIPSQADCKACHDKNTQRVGGNDVKVPVIGFDELRLNHKLAGQTQIQLKVLAAKGLFFKAPPAAPEAVTGTALAIKAKGWIHGNCAHCHNGGFKYEARHNLVEAATINVPQKKPYVVPKDPAQSVLYQSAVLWNIKGVPDMPKIGVAAPDPAAKKILSDWINNLP